MTSKQKEKLLISLGFKYVKKGDSYIRKIKHSFLEGTVIITTLDSYFISVFCLTKNLNFNKQAMIISKRFTRLNAIKLISFLEND